MKLLRIVWASPCTAVGVLAGAVLMLFGARPRPVGGVLEVALRESRADCGGRLAALPFRAITFGHVILGVTAEELDEFRPHEHVHVRQYERLGLLFFVAYPVASLCAFLRGGDPYRDNRFEVQARALSDADSIRGRLGS